MKKESSCLICNKKFFYKSNQSVGKYCSNRCRYEGMKLRTHTVGQKIGFRHSKESKELMSFKVSESWKKNREKYISGFIRREENKSIEQNELVKQHLKAIARKPSVVLNICEYCNKETIKNKRNSRVFCSPECNRKSRIGKIPWNKGIEFLQMEKNPNWRGGIGNLPYSPEFNKKLKSKIRKRDNYQCVNCKMTEEEHLIVYGKALHIHHIDYDKMNCHESNLIASCVSCNFRFNFNRSYWKDKLQNYIASFTNDVSKEYIRLGDV